MTEEQLLTDLETMPPGLLKELHADELSSLTEHTSEPLFPGSGTETNRPGSSTYTENTPPGNAFNDTITKQNFVNGSLVDAELALNIADMGISTVLSAAIKQLKGRVVNRARFAATEREKAQIKPALQNYLASINFNIDNPFTALMLIVALVYGPKTLDILNEPIPERERAAMPVIKPERSTTSTSSVPGEKVPKKGTFSSKNQPLGRGRRPGTKNKIK